MILRSHFFGGVRRGCSLSFPFSFVFCLLTALHDRRSKSLNFLVFHTSMRTLSRLAAFSLLNFYSTAPGCSSINSPILMICRQLIFFSLCLSVTSGGFLTRISMGSLHFWSLSSWAASCRSTFMSFHSFTVSHVNCDCLHLTEFQILLRIYSCYSFKYEFIPFGLC